MTGLTITVPQQVRCRFGRWANIGEGSDGFAADDCFCQWVLQDLQQHRDEPRLVWPNLRAAKQVHQNAILGLANKFR